MKKGKAVQLVLDELESAIQKHPGFPADIVYAAAIMAEEAGEAMQAAIDYATDWQVREEIGKHHFVHEIAQTASVCLRILMHIEDLRHTEQKMYLDIDGIIEE